MYFYHYVYKKGFMIYKRNRKSRTKALIKPPTTTLKNYKLLQRHHSVYVRNKKAHCFAKTPVLKCLGLHPISNRMHNCPTLSKFAVATKQ